MLDSEIQTYNEQKGDQDWNEDDGYSTLCCECQEFPVCEGSRLVGKYWVPFSPLKWFLEFTCGEESTYNCRTGWTLCCCCFLCILFCLVVIELTILLFLGTLFAVSFLTMIIIVAAVGIVVLFFVACYFCAINCGPLFKALGDCCEICLSCLELCEPILEICAACN